MATLKLDSTSLNGSISVMETSSLQSLFASVLLEEERVEKELEELIKKQSVLEKKMVLLRDTIPTLQILQTDAKQLDGMISFTSTLAESISGKVRQLDLAKSRVVACMQRVEDICDLKYCTDGVQTALQDEDYEKAAAHVHRFLSLDEDVLRMSADASEGSTLETSFHLLHEAQSKLKTIIHSRFDAAVHSGDIASVERFFKIFPLIGQQEEGLTKFSKYLAAQLTDTADNNLKLALASGSNDKRANVIYADTITMLFESIARVVEIHQPLVETYYGPGKIFTMMQQLQKECDRQARKILEHFKRNRDFDHKIQLVQQVHQQRSNVSRLDPKEMDVLLSEITLINSRTELYFRFLKRRIVGDIEVAYQDEKVKSDLLLEVDQFLVNCELSRQMQELVGFYIMLEEFFMHEMVSKAVSLESADDSSLTSSMVDDVFFVVKKSIRRAMSTSSIDCLCAMLNHSCTIFEQDFREVILTRLRQGFPSGFDLVQAYNFVQMTIQQGRLQTADSETEKIKTNFLLALNNADVSCGFLQTLKTSIEEEANVIHAQANKQSKAKLESCIADLVAISVKFKECLDYGFSQLSYSALKPRIKPWVDAILSVNHNMTEEDFASYEANDPWVQTFIVNVDGLLMTFKNSLTSANYDTLVGLVCNEVTSQLEKAVLKMTFNRIGGLQMDKELRSLIGYLTSVTTWSVRDKFARLTQIATVLNLETVNELMEYWGSNSGTLMWRLTPGEIRQILALRLDFKNDDIKKLKL